MKSKWKAAACVLGFVGVLVAVGAFHHHLAHRGQMGGPAAGRMPSMADRTGITATGYAEVKSQKTAPATYEVTIMDKAGADELQARVTEFQSKTDQLKAALAQAGIAADDIRVISFAVTPYRDPYGKDFPYDGPATAMEQPDTYQLRATLQVTAATAAQQVALFKTAAQNGAYAVDAYGYKGYPRDTYFDTATLEPAVKQATEQAKALAAAQAAAAGVRLGALRSIEVRQPDLYAGPDEGYRVTVNVTYDIAAATAK